MTVGAACAEAAFHGFEHDVADVGAADPGDDHGAPNDDFAVMRVDEEGPVPAGKLEPVAAPVDRQAICMTIQPRGGAGSNA